ncbi:MAG: lytic transglycosylase domain-containing protein [Vicinamibacteraceae bacterium]
MTFSIRSVALGLLAGLALAGPARADLVVLSSGRVISASSVVLTADSATIRLRGGGEVTCDRSLVVRVDADETPWIDPAADLGGATDPSGAKGLALPANAAPVRVVEIPAAYRGVITRLAEAHGVDARLIHAVISVESAYRPRARSRKGARGLMQLMPATARQYGVHNAYQTTANIDAGVRHLKTLLDRFALRDAIAAYNAGEAAVRRFGGVPPFRETRAYVERVLSLAGLEPATDEPPPGPDDPSDLPGS